MTKQELSAKVAELRELKRMADELDEMIESIEDSIKETMTENGVDELRGADWKVTWKKISSNRFDSTTFKKSEPELYAQYTKTFESRRFCVA